MLCQLPKWVTCKNRVKSFLWALATVYLSFFFFVTFLFVCQYFPLIFLIKLAVIQEKNIPVHMSLCLLQANAVKIHQFLLFFFFPVDCNTVVFISYVIKTKYLFVLFCFVLLQNKTQSLKYIIRLPMQAKSILCIISKALSSFTNEPTHLKFIQTVNELWIDKCLLHFYSPLHFWLDIFYFSNRYKLSRLKLTTDIIFLPSLGW